MYYKVGKILAKEILAVPSLRSNRQLLNGKGNFCGPPQQRCHPLQQRAHYQQQLHQTLKLNWSVSFPGESDVLWPPIPESTLVWQDSKHSSPASLKPLPRSNYSTIHLLLFIQRTCFKIRRFLYLSVSLSLCLSLLPIHLKIFFDFLRGTLGTNVLLIISLEGFMAFEYLLNSCWFEIS